MPPKRKSSPADRLTALFNAKMVLSVIMVAVGALGLSLLFPEVTSDLLGIDVRDRKRSADVFLRLLAACFIGQTVLLYHAVVNIDAKARRGYIVGFFTEFFLGMVVLFRKSVAVPSPVNIGLGSVGLIFSLALAYFIFIREERYTIAQHTDQKLARASAQLEAMQIERDGAVQQQDDLRRRCDQLVSEKDGLLRKNEELKRVALAPQAPVRQAPTNEAQVKALKDRIAQLEVELGEAKLAAYKKTSSAPAPKKLDAGLSEAARLQKIAEAEKRDKAARKEEQQKELQERLKKKRKEEEEELMKILNE